MLKKETKWNVDIESIKDPDLVGWSEEFMRAQTQMRQRTHHHELYGLLAKNKSIHEWTVKKGNSKYFSEGSTQYILRKTLADTIQRVPDGELQTQFDKASMEHIWTEYLFENKVMWSEFEGIDMMSNFTNTFKMAFVYAFAPVRIGFERDYDDDVRISYNLENWADVFVNPDCKDIRRPQTVWFRQYMSKEEVKGLIDEEGNVFDSTYEAETIKYCIDHELFSAKRWESEKMADKLKGATAIESLTLLTKYERGAKEFVTYVPEIGAVFRRVPNYDPRKGIPWSFFVLETDPDFPLGVSQVEFLLGDQQFNDLFQTSAYKNLLLAMEPPIMVAGWETNPSSYVFEPRKIWNLGNNPNQVRVDPVKIDNSVLSGWSTTRESIAASMLRNLNVMDGTVAKDSGTTFSKTAPGVRAQQEAKTININQYQKRMEFFISEWANQALRMYISSMGGVHELTVDEKTRRKLFDLGEEAAQTIVGDKVEIDFDRLSTDLLEFKVRAGSLVQLKEDQERAALSEMVQPFIQNLQGWSDENKQVIENEVLLPVAKRMLELSDTDIGQTLAESIGTQMAKLMMADMQSQIDMQGQQIQQQGMAMEQMQQALPPEAQAQLAQGQMPEPMAEGSPAPETPPVPGPEEVASPGSLPGPEAKEPDRQVISDSDLLTI